MNKYKNCQIEPWSNGFQIVPGTLTSISSFIIKTEDFACGVAFAMGMLERMASSHVSEEDVQSEVEKTLENLIDSGKLKNLEEYTFELHSGKFLQVDNPSWWKKSS